MNTADELRSELLKCFALARDGKLAGDALRGVIGCANQINISVAVEMKARAQLAREGQATGVFGSLRLGSTSAEDA